MHEATIVFKEGNQTHLIVNVSFEDLSEEIETNTQIDHIEGDHFDKKLYKYMHILGRILRKHAEEFYEFRKGG